MVIRYAVTFETDNDPPVTIRGQVVASNPQAGARLSVKDAQRQAKGKRWRTMAILLEKVAEAELDSERAADDEYFRSGTRYPGQ